MFFLFSFEFVGFEIFNAGLARQSLDSLSQGVVFDICHVFTLSVTYLTKWTFADYRLECEFRLTHIYSVTLSVRSPILLGLDRSRFLFLLKHYANYNNKVKIKYK